MLSLWRLVLSRIGLTIPLLWTWHSSHRFCLLPGPLSIQFWSRAIGNERPYHVVEEAKTEQDYYAWLEWVVFRPAVHAVAAVRDQLYSAAAVPVPLDIQGVTRTQCLNNTVPRGTTDIISEVAKRCFAAHEIKRTRVLLGRRSDGPGVQTLRVVVELARERDGYSFRDAEKGLREKARKLLCQVRQLALL